MGKVTTYIYSPTGKETAEDDFNGGNQQFQSAGYTYDADDRCQRLSDGLGHNTTYTYDGVGNLTARQGRQLAHDVLCLRFPEPLDDDHRCAEPHHGLWL